MRVDKRRLSRHATVTDWSVLVVTGRCGASHARVTCIACPLKAECTESSRGRIVHRSLYADYLERVRGYHATEAYKKAMRKRQVWVEPLFAEAKLWHGLRRFRRRGLENVNREGLLIAAGQNLSRCRMTISST